VQGKQEYVFGSYNDRTGPTQGFVISDASNGTTTGTLVFQVVSGNVPLVGSLISVVGTANGAANFNVTNGQILNVSSTEQGVVTVTYTIASTATPTTQTQDFGSVLVPQIELGDVLAVSGTVSSVPVTAPASPSQQSGKSLSATVSLPAQQGGVASTLTGITVVIQGSNVDRDDHYNTIGTVCTTTSAPGSGTTTIDWQSGQGNTSTGTLAAGSVNLPEFKFYRLQVTAGSGTGPIVGSIMI
jgi:hypothetical protein